MKNALSLEKKKKLRLASEERSVMVFQRFEFMKKFKVKRLKFEENERKKNKMKIKRSKSESKGILKEFTHSELVKNSLAKNIKKMKNHPSYDSLKLATKFNSKEKLKMIETDFNRCISNLIQSKEELERKAKKFRAKPPKNFKTMPQGSVINSLEYSLRKIKKIDFSSSSLKNEKSHIFEVSKCQNQLSLPKISQPSTERNRVYLTSTTHRTKRKRRFKTEASIKQKNILVLATTRENLKNIPLFGFSKTPHVIKSKGKMFPGFKKRKVLGDKRAGKEILDNKEEEKIKKSERLNSLQNLKDIFS